MLFKGDLVDILIFFTILFLIGMGAFVFYMVKKKFKMMVMVYKYYYQI
jgi:hypothetical protein